MFRTILQKELLESFREKRIRIAVGIFWVLSLAAIFSSYQHYTALARLHEEAQNESYHQWLNQGEKNPHSGAHFGVYVFKPIPAMSIWDKGVDDYYGTSLWLEPHKQSNIQYKPIQDQTGLARFGPLWPSTVFNVLAPLLLLLLSFNSINKEQSTGCLAMLRSLKTPLLPLVGGKVLAVYFAAMIITIPVFFATQLAAIAAAGWETYREVLPFAGVLLLTYILYYATISIAGVLLSAVFSSQAGALTAGLAFWMAIAVIIPRTVSEYVRTAIPHASAFEFYQEVREDMAKGINGYGDARARKVKLEQETLEKYGADSLQALPVNFAGISLLASEAFSWAVFDKHFNQITTAFEQQRAFAGQLNILSPVMAAGAISQALSRTDMHSSLSFSEQAETHRRLIQTIVNESYAQMGAGNNREVKAGKELWEKVPPFHFQPLAFGTVWQGIRLHVFQLLFWFLASLGLLALASRHYFKQSDHV